MTDKKTEALKLALEALELALDNLHDHGDNCFLHDEGEYNICFCGKDSLSNHLRSIIEKLDEALEEQPAEHQEPIAWMDNDGNVSDNNDYNCFPIPLFTYQPSSKPLTDEWQPSETGPQDGTPCLVYWGQSFGVPLIGVARRIYPDRGEMLWHGHGGSHNEVTHWMPLPDAPIEAAHGIKEQP